MDTSFGGTAKKPQPSSTPPPPLMDDNNYLQLEGSSPIHIPSSQVRVGELDTCEDEAGQLQLETMDSADDSSVSQQ